MRRDGWSVVAVIGIAVLVIALLWLVTRSGPSAGGVTPDLVPIPTNTPTP